MTQLTTLSDDPFFRLTGDTEWNACIGPQGHEENYVDGYMEAALYLSRAVVTIPRQSRGHSGCEPLKAAVRGR